MSITKASANGYITLTESYTIPDSAGANVVTVNGSTISEDLSGKKFTVSVTMTALCAGDGALDVKIQASPDGTNWVDVDASLSMDVDTTTVGNADAGLADLTNVYAPYYRAVVFSDGTDLLDAGACTLVLAIKE
jgi:hypothetical protein